MTDATILIVDDDELVRSGLAFDLERAGYQVLVACSGTDALRLLDSQPVDLILSDLLMEEMDGFGLLREVRKRSRTLPFIVLTGHGTVPRALEAIRQGANEFLQKPADPDTISECVRTALETARLDQNIQSEHHQLQEKRAEEHKRLLRDQRMLSLSSLAEGIADYVANLSASVMDTMAGMSKALPDDHPLKKKTRELYHARQRAHSLIHDLRVIGQEAPPSAVPVSLDVIIQDCLQSPEVTELKTLVPDVQVAYEKRSEVPPVLAADRQLLIMLWNLLAHAMEGMPPGGRITLSVNKAPDDFTVPGQTDGGRDYVLCRLEDSAPEPPALDLERLFEPFQYRMVDGQRTRYGLGLSVVYRIVRAHGGWVEAAYTEGAGSCYDVYLPAVERRHDGTRLHGAVGDETILIVDDSPIHRKSAVLILTEQGYRTVEAASSAEALEYLGKVRTDDRDIDLVVIDLILGENMDGVDLYEAILQMRPKQKAVLVSGFSALNRIQHARKKGLVTLVSKPFDPAVLAKAVRTELDR